MASNPKRCIDLDVSDGRLILYGCHAPDSAGNQAHNCSGGGNKANKGTQHNRARKESSDMDSV